MTVLLSTWKMDEALEDKKGKNAVPAFKKGEKEE